MSHYRVTCSALLYGQVCQNVLHFVNFNDVFTPEQVANDVISNYINQVRKRQQNDLRWFNILAQNLSDVVVAPFSKVLDLPGLNLGSQSMPSFASYVLRLSTAKAGRHGRGRIFVPGINFNSSEKGFFTTAEINSWETDVMPTLRSAYVDELNNNLTLCVREKSGVMNPVTAIQLRNVVGCQRRRMPGVGI